MGGIAGIFYYDHNRMVDKNELKKMGTVMSHRGPDGTTYLVDNNIGFIHFRLHDTPHSVFEQLPAVSAHEKIYLTFHGRLDNREQIFTKLDLTQKIKEVTDSELILAAYLKWGINCTDFLLGDFVCAIFESSANKLVCIRDHMGIAPFYYLIGKDYFAFASEIRGLLTLTEFSAQMNKERVADFLVGVTSDSETTFYKNIKRLRPAHYLVSQGSDIKIYKYWSLEKHELPDKDYAEMFFDIFSEAVRCRLQTYFPTGIRLSGGLDSASIAACMSSYAENNNIKFASLSGVFSNLTECDEKDYIDEIIKDRHILPYFVEGDQIKPGKLFDEKCEVFDEPFFAPHSFLSWVIYKKAQKEGIKVLFDGYDGDSVVSYGYEALYDFFRQRRFNRLLSECYYISGNNIRKTCSYVRTIFKRFIVDMHLFYSWHVKRAINRDVKYAASVLNSTFSSQSLISQRIERIHQSRPCRTSPAHVSHIYTLQHPFATTVIESLDKESSWFGIKACHPFFDKRVLEFCVSLPVEEKISQGFNRYIVRKALRKHLPTRVTQRRNKTNFLPNYLRAYTELDTRWLIESVKTIPDHMFDLIDKKDFNERKRYLFDTNHVKKNQALSMTLKVISLSKWLAKNKL